MSRVLHIISSPRGEHSVSQALTTEIVSSYAHSRSDAAVDTLNLWHENLRPFGPEHVAAKMAVIGGSAPPPSTGSAWSDAMAQFERFDQSDVYVIGAPMWNGGIPWILKLYIDIITQPGRLFRFDPSTGYAGLLHRKRAAVVYTSSVYRPGVSRDFGVDFHSTYLGNWLRFAGVGEVHEVRMQPARQGDPLFTQRLEAKLQESRDLGTRLATGQDSTSSARSPHDGG